MKKRNIMYIALCVILTGMFLLCGWCYTNGTDNELRQYKKEIERMDLIQIYDSSDLDFDIIEGRAANGEILIEEVIGQVIDDEGNGRILNPARPDYDYISYKRVEEARKGDIILSYMIYNPDNNYIDDIIDRFDYIIDYEKFLLD